MMIKYNSQRHSGKFAQQIYPESSYVFRHYAFSQNATGFRINLLRKFSGMTLLVISLFLTACTAVHNPDAYLPARSSVSAGQTITVQGNKNLYAIAREHNVSMRDMIVLNNLQPPFALKPGQSLVLPSGAGGSSDDGLISGGGMPIGAATYAPVSSPGSVTSGSGVSSSAVESSELAPVQSAPSHSSALASGPSTKGVANPIWKPTQVEALNTPSQAPKQLATTVDVKPVNSPMGSPASISQPSIAVPPPAAAPAAAPPATPVDLIWPVQGPVLSGFGPKGQGVNNDGVNIGAPKGSPVVAAGNGIVVYAGNEMKGFGNLILIRHQGGWVTAYANLDRAMVTKDAVVAQGDMIGTVGKTGNVSSPQLHFEVRYKDKAVDPNSVIKAP